MATISVLYTIGVGMERVAFRLPRRWLAREVFEERHHLPLQPYCFPGCRQPFGASRLHRSPSSSSVLHSSHETYVIHSSRFHNVMFMHKKISLVRFDFQKPIVGLGLHIEENDISFNLINKDTQLMNDGYLGKVQGKKMH